MFKLRITVGCTVRVGVRVRFGVTVGVKDRVIKQAIQLCKLLETGFMSK